MNKFSCFFFLLLFNIPLAAQNHDYQWLFGKYSFDSNPNNGGSVLDFNTYPPDVYYQYRDMNIDMTNASICDSTGNLLFYTNGIYIANQEHEIMENGEGLNPGQVAEDFLDIGYRLPQGALIIPFQTDSSDYYLFHAAIEYGLNPTIAVKKMYFSIIEFDNPLGSVTKKNELMLEDVFDLGKITATKHGNGRDWWILIPKRNSNIFYKWLLTPEGVSEAIIQEVDFSIPEGLGQATFSPDGKKYVNNSLIGGFEVEDVLNILDFDRCTGELSNHIQLVYADSAMAGGAAISPNSRYLYVPHHLNIYQYDLEAEDIENPMTLVAEYDGYISDVPTTFFLAQLAPDGKIYVNAPNSVNVLHVINHPDRPGTDCEVIQHAVQLPTMNRFSLPNFPNYRLGPLDGSPCDTLGLDNLPLADFTWEADTIFPQNIEFTDNSFYEPEEWFWEFDDGATSMEINPLHEYSEIGVYNVCLTVSNQYDSDTKCREVLIDQIVATGEVANPDIFFAVSPNPASEWLQLQWRFSSRVPAKWRLYDAFGREVAAQKLLARQGLEVFYLENLESGIYFWEVLQGGRKVKSGKVVLVE